MGNFNIQVTGLQAAIDRITPAVINEKVKDELNAFGLDVVNDAKQLAPTDEGYLKNSISHVMVNDNTVEIKVNTNYAAYVEFGTRRFAASYVSTLPQEWRIFASQFKGKGGGDYFDFLNNILDWVIRKGIANRYSIKTQQPIKINIKNPSKAGIGKDDYERLHSAAYAIALSILKKGVKPHPFLYPAVEKNRPLLEKRIKDILNA